LERLNIGRFVIQQIEKSFTVHCFAPGERTVGLRKSFPHLLPGANQCCGSALLVDPFWQKLSKLGWIEG